MHELEPLIGELQEQARFTDAWKRALKKFRQSMECVSTNVPSRRVCIDEREDGDASDAPVSPMMMYLRR